MSEDRLAAKAAHLHFEREKGLVEYLLDRLKLRVASISNPNTEAGETGMDAVVHLVDGRFVAIQVTEIDPHPSPGRARAQEKFLNTKHAGKGDYTQNDPGVVLDSLVRTIERKVGIAARHRSHGIETWLLICGSVPDAPISTFVMSPWLSAVDMNKATDSVLRESKFDRCFFLSILGVEQALYQWDRSHRWRKSVALRDLHESPREPYVRDLLRAAEANDPNEMDRLLEEECKMALREMRSLKTV